MQYSSVCNMSEYAVFIQGAYKCFGHGSGSNHVLYNLNMKVEKGSIYALLGASGCGKTTLLNCIVGLLRLNSGHIQVIKGIPRPQVGYMPQSTSLINEFSVKNTVYYFGMLFSMSKQKLEQRYKFLANLLELPDADAFIKNLSGGQQRRVSLAAALIHDPDLLALDEPTVGVDPILRQSIWDYLAHITSDKRVTVIITTHYIEEAVQAHTVGLMRNGKLLAEDSPLNLLSMYSCSTLEEVFLKLSIRETNDATEDKAHTFEMNNVGPQMTRKNILTNSTGTPSSPANGVGRERYKDCELLSWNRLQAMLMKNFIIILRNPGGLAFVVLFPIMEVCLFFFAIGHHPYGLKLAVVNEELREYATCRELMSHNGSRISNNGTDECLFNGVSCIYLNMIDATTVIKQYYPSMEAAKRAVQKGDVVGLIHFSENYSQQIHERLLHSPLISPEVVDESEIIVQMDMTNQHSALLVENVLYDQFMKLSDKLALACNVSTRSIHIPITFNTPVYGSKQPRYHISVAPGMLTLTVYFLATVITASLIVTERAEGIWNRNIVAGVTSAEILLSFFLSQLLCVVLQCVEVVLMSIYVFGLQCRGSLVTLLTIIFLQGICGMMFGLLISVLSNSFSMAVFVSLGSYIPYLNLCGVLWPIEGMPSALKWFSLFLPGTLATRSVDNILQKGWSLMHPQVYYGFLVTIGWTVVQLVFSIAVLGYKDMKLC